MSTEEKIGMIFEVIGNIGCTCIGLSAGKKLSEGKTLLERICIKTATTGLSLYAGDISSKALKENYAVPIANVLDKAKSKMHEEEVTVNV